MIIPPSLKSRNLNDGFLGVSFPAGNIVPYLLRPFLSQICTTRTHHQDMSEKLSLGKPIPAI